MIIDFQHHYTPPHLLKSAKVQAMPINRAGKVPKYYVPPALLDLDEQIRAMDYAGIDMAVLTCGLGMDGSDLEICRLVNDAMQEAVRRHPARFLTLAHAPALGGAKAMEELERCAGEYGVPGVVTTSEIDGRPLDSPELDPFWKTCERLGLYVFVHPALRPNVGEHLDAHDLVRAVGREFSLTTAMLRLVIGGVLDRYPGLKVQFGHLAGNAAVHFGRLRGFLQRENWGTAGDPVHGRVPEGPLEYYLHNNLWFDTAGIFGSVNAVRATLSEIEATRVVFGTDYPLEIRTDEDLKNFVNGLRALGPDGNAILSSSAEALLRPARSVAA